VAGDWYEALTRPGGEVVFGVGDAAGHGLAAVAAMAELRNAARGLAVAGMTPSAILGHLSALLSATTTSESIATAFYATFDPASGTGLWSLAGHPPPLLAGPDQPPEFLLGPTGVPLGVVDSPGYTDGQLTLGPDAALIAVTDGVVERRGRSLDTGLAELAEVVAAERTRDAATIADRVADEFCAEPADDCCVLVLHYTPA
jgi:serine phosphatase RsbU (regulator of sigma subunit)